MIIKNNTLVKNYCLYITDAMNKVEVVLFEYLNKDNISLYPAHCTTAADITGESGFANNRVCSAGVKVLGYSELKVAEKSNNRLAYDEGRAYPSLVMNRITNLNLELCTVYIFANVN